jgi:hypothetical protein
MLACAVAAVAMTAAVACGGDDDGGPSASDTPNLQTPQGVDVTPFATPLIEGNNLTSDSKKYAAVIPEGWNVRINLIQTPDGSADAFFEPLTPDAKLQANIAVTCSTTQSFPDATRVPIEKTTRARMSTTTELTEGQAMIDGRNVATLTYINQSSQDPNSPQLRKTDYFFSGGTCDYTLSTISAVGDEAKYKPIFDAFLASFRILD